MSAELQSPRMSLYQIESGLAELMIARDEAEDESGRAACDQAIREYVAREIRKVDSIRGYLLDLRSRAAEAREEAARCLNFAHMLEAREKRIKQMCVDVMQSSGKKTLEGTVGALRVQGNGGLAPLVIDQWDAENWKWTGLSFLPDEFQVVTAKMPVSVFREVENVPGVAAVCWEPDGDKIREAINREGGVPGAVILERGSHLRVL